MSRRAASMPPRERGADRAHGRGGRLGLSLAGGTPPGATPVVYVHGVPNTARLWQPFLERTGGLAPDLPGFGLSAKPAAFDYSIAGLSGWLKSFLAERGVERYSLVAHDWGAVALALAQAEPQRLERLVLMDAVPLLPGYEWHTLARQWRRPGWWARWPWASRSSSWRAGCCVCPTAATSPPTSLTTSGTTSTTARNGRSCACTARHRHARSRRRGHSSTGSRAPRSWSGATPIPTCRWASRTTTPGRSAALPTLRSSRGRRLAVDRAPRGGRTGGRLPGVSELWNKLQRAYEVGNRGARQGDALPDPAVAGDHLRDRAGNHPRHSQRGLMVARWQPGDEVRPPHPPHGPGHPAADSQRLPEPVAGTRHPLARVAGGGVRRRAWADPG